MKSVHSDMIFHPCNVVFRHAACPPAIIGYDEEGEPVIVKFKHEGGVGGQLEFERAARHLVHYEGFERVKEYLEKMAEILVAGNEALNRFEAIDWEDTDASPLEDAKLFLYESKGIEE